MSGAVAFRKLEQLADPARLKLVIESLNFGSKDEYDDRSCYMNNIAVIKTVTNQPIMKSTKASELTGIKMLTPPQGMNGQHTEAVMKAMAASAIVAFSLQFKTTGGGGGGAGDHYFSSFQLDGSTIVASMGWQKLYTFADWFRENNGGRFSSANFKALMLKIENGDIDGVGGLCGFLGETRDSTMKDKKLIPTLLSNDIAGCKPKFVNTCYFDLPAS
jgi:hypothetical protein